MINLKKIFKQFKETIETKERSSFKQFYPFSKYIISLKKSLYG